MVGFFDIIQAYFTQVTGRFIMFSGRDMELLRAWRVQGASPAVVCRGIREAVLFTQEADGQPPRNIWACRKFILPHVERLGLIAIDPDTRGVAAALPKAPSRHQTNAVLRQALSALEGAGHHCEDGALRALYREMWYRLESSIKHDSAIDAQYEQLLRLEDDLTQGYFSALSMEEQRRIDKHLDEQDRDTSMRMSPEAWSRHRTARRHRVLVQQYGLVKLID